ncbi:hypothetical protein C9F11_24020 [Streptomyces sp. YIM 121038]|uniref:hypothetical protein n=1 Tax=Streptomyces sp. YIM 121038 TaxID=2136401 RepID=UPI001163362D|nr:hypothetical protein [Streptomyces sp. YIM 121038]QCX78420.1 hypothetical protein C9F11_24020 [Streptomyces sp. YIM 121038]
MSAPFDDRPPGPGEYRARGDLVRSLVPGAVLAAVPAARAAAEAEGHRLRFDFLDDAAVLELLRLRHLDEAALHRAGVRLGVPTALVAFALFAGWGAYAQHWEPGRDQYLYYGLCGAVGVLVVVLYAVTLTRHWGSRPRQRVRARAAAYRRIAHLARDGGAPLPDAYPHYGPYPFAARYRPEAATDDGDGGAADLDMPADRRGGPPGAPDGKGPR